MFGRELNRKKKGVFLRRSPCVFPNRDVSSWSRFFGKGGVLICIGDDNGNRFKGMRGVGSWLKEDQRLVSGGIFIF
jgi:hypothetical protein